MRKIEPINISYISYIKNIFKPLLKRLEDSTNGTIQAGGLLIVTIPFLLICLGKMILSLLFSFSVKNIEDDFRAFILALGALITSLVLFISNFALAVGMLLILMPLNLVWSFLSFPYAFYQSSQFNAAVDEYNKAVGEYDKTLVKAATNNIEKFHLIQSSIIALKNTISCLRKLLLFEDGYIENIENFENQLRDLMNEESTIYAAITTPVVVKCNQAEDAVIAADQQVNISATPQTIAQAQAQKLLAMERHVVALTEAQGCVTTLQPNGQIVAHDASEPNIITDYKNNLQQQLETANLNASVQSHIVEDIAKNAYLGYLNASSGISVEATEYSADQKVLAAQNIAARANANVEKWLAMQKQVNNLKKALCYVEVLQFVPRQIVKLGLVEIGPESNKEETVKTILEAQANDLKIKLASAKKKAGEVDPCRIDIETAKAAATTPEDKAIAQKDKLFAMRHKVEALIYKITSYEALIGASRQIVELGLVEVDPKCTAEQGVNLLIGELTTDIDKFKVQFHSALEELEALEKLEKVSSVSKFSAPELNIMSTVPAPPYRFYSGMLNSLCNTILNWCGAAASETSDKLRLKP